MQAPEIKIDVPFAHALQPLVDVAWSPLQATSEVAGLTARACEELRHALLHRLSEIASQPLGRLFSGKRTLTDVALARIADGKAAGSTTERYEQFCRAQLDSGFGTMLVEFPVLGRLLATVVIHWTTACQEMLTRLTTDRVAIERIFGIRRDASIVSLTTGLSDSHRAGREVVIVTFEDDIRLVYKPRAVDIEARFQDFLAVFGEVLPSGSLRRLAVLPLGEYGYVEHVAPKVATGPSALTRFYWNAGRVLAILYVVGATDCHWENMIAVDDQILLIDAETLFEGVPSSSVERSASEAKSLASERIEDSVLRTGMLPAWISVGPAHAIDISALGTPGSKDARTRKPSWCFTNSDDMVWGEREVESLQATCLPVNAGTPNPLSDYSDDLIAGFEEVLVALRRPEVLEQARAGLGAFRGVRRRVVVRPTRTYVLLQRQALDPDSLRDPDERALQLERLARAYISGEERPRTWPLLLHEIAALENLDVPYFEGEVGSSDLFVGSDLVIERYYQKEGLEQALDRLDRLSETECRWQIRLIRGAIGAHRFEMAEVPDQRERVEDAPSPQGSHGAHDVARLIAAEMLEDPAGPPTWLTVALLADATRVQLGLVPPGLYDGRAGIAAFLYDCNEGALATDVLRPVVDALNDGEEARIHRYMRSVGLGTAGIGGILRLFRYLSGSHEMVPTWDEQSDRVIAALSEEVLVSEEASDLVSGIAGLVAPVAAFHKSTPTGASARVLSCVGALLLERQDEAGGWSLAQGHPALVGLSHGASGIAVALAELADALGDDRYAAAAARGVGFETALFDAEARNWPDLRRGLAQVNRLAMRSWCHGSVGIALARLRMLELLSTHDDAERWREQLIVAVESSISSRLTPVDHLCCGNIGRAAVITLVGQAVGNRRWEYEGCRLGATVASAAGGSPENYRLLLGIDGASGLRLPGLMTGLAGIGMYLLHGQDLRWARYLLL
jgi:type 2 lantibiotic biosynthesis protein LanM